MKKSNPFNSKSNTKNNNKSNNGNSRFSSLIDDVPETNVFIANANTELKVNTRFDGLKDEPIIELSNNVERQGGERQGGERQGGERQGGERQGGERSRAMPRFNSFSNSNNNSNRNVKVEPKPFVFIENEFPDIKPNNQKLGVNESKSVNETNEEPSLIKNNAWGIAVQAAKEKSKQKALEREMEIERQNQMDKPVEPGWVCFSKDKKTGKSKVIYGPLTEEQKQYEKIRYLEEHSLKYNMYKTIERMSVRWQEYREQFDELHGPGAYQEKYGCEHAYGYDSDSESDEDSDDYE
jgi:hypothetical protein